MQALWSLLSNKTLLVNLLTPLFAWLAAKGFVLSPDQQAALIAGAMVVANVVVEHFTSPGLTSKTPATHFGASP